MFKRENRYLVIKISDAQKALTVDGLNLLDALAFDVESYRLRMGKQPLECVVVEKDWPEYEPVWKMIKDRVNGTTEN